MPPPREDVVLGPIRVATANFQSLDMAAALKEDTVSKKARLVQDQLWAEGVHVLLGQEARAKLKRTTTKAYHCIWGPANKGQHGCCAFVSKVLSFGTVGKAHIRVKGDDVVLLHADPRRLFIAVRTPYFTFTAASLHTPHERRPAEERKAW